MVLDIKKLGKLEGEIAKAATGAFPIILVDTGALIDITHSARGYGLNGHKGTETNLAYMDPVSFLKRVSGLAPLLITPKTYREIQDHSRVMINNHVPEINQNTLDFSLQTMADSVRFVDGLNPGLLPDDAAYDAYWASKEGCLTNAKKSLEGCSDTDKEILFTAAYLSNCRKPLSPDKVSSVIVLSPDSHIIMGLEFLKKGFNERYFPLVPLSTRSTR